MAWLEANWPWVVVCSVMYVRIWVLERRFSTYVNAIAKPLTLMQRAILGLSFAHDNESDHSHFISEGRSHRSAGGESTVRTARHDVDQHRNFALRD